MKTTRRNFITLSGAGLLATTLPGSASFQDQVVSDNAKITFSLGIASYTFRKFSLDETLRMTKRLAISRITFKDMHLPLDASDEVFESTLTKCKEAGISCYGAGVITMKTKEAVDDAFEYARKAKLEMIIGVPDHELLSYTESKVKESGIKLAIHNHGPGDEKYPSAESAYELIKNMDPGMGICLDIGHTMRIKRDPVQDFVDHSGRIFDIHIKDVTSASEDAKECEIGRGVIDIQSFLKALVKMGYSGRIAFEYEKEEMYPFQ